jgi:uncharacterized Fe-S cluster-containing protein
MKNKQAIAYLLFCSMSEIMLSQYENTSMLKVYDPSLHLKLKNLKANFERVSKQAHVMFTENEQLVFFDLINLFESLLKKASDETSFKEIIEIIKAWDLGELKVIESEKL